MEQMKQRRRPRFIHGIVTKYRPGSSRQVAFWQMQEPDPGDGRYNRYPLFCD